MKPFLIVVGILLLAAVLAACVRKPAVQIEPAAYDAAVQRQIAEDSLSFLQSRIGDDATFSAIADAFDALCAEPTADEEILFEAGTYKLIREPIGEPRFTVSLARQIPNGEDEFFQIRAELLFLPDADNAQIVRNFARLVHGHVEINPDKHPLALHLQITQIFHAFSFNVLRRSSASSAG